MQRRLALVLLATLSLAGRAGAEAAGPVAAVGPSSALGSGGHSQTLDRTRVGLLGAAARRDRVRDPRLDAVPGVEDPELRSLWEVALSLEDQSRREQAVHVYESLVPQIAGSAAAHWRLARLQWLIGDAMPRNEEPGTPALAHYRLAEDWAQRGLEIDPACAECMLWRYAALGRIIVVEGLLSGVRHARTMSSLLDEGIALQPTYRDNAYNSTLGNLYYARAIFNRMVPDSWWINLLVGVRGDKEEALADIEMALALNGDRIDYQVEKGAILMCLGATRGRDERVEQGRVVLQEAMGLERRLETDGLDLALARQMMSAPETACGFTREGFVDVDGAAKKL